MKVYKIILILFILQLQIKSNYAVQNNKNLQDTQYLKHNKYHNIKNQQNNINQHFTEQNINTTVINNTTQQNNTNNTEGDKSQNKDSYGHTKEEHAIWGTVILVILIGIGVVIFFIWRHKVHGQEAIDNIQMNPEQQIQQQTLNKEQQEQLQEYKFQARDKNCKVFSAVDEEDNTKNNSNQDEDYNPQEKDQCFIVQFQGSSQFKGQKQAPEKDKKKQTSDFVYFEVEILELPNPDTKISIGYQLEQDYNKKVHIGSKLSNNSVCFDSKGVVTYYSSKNKNGNPVVYDYKRNSIKQDKLFAKSYFDLQFQNTQTQFQLSSNFHTQKNPKDQAILILQNSVVKINSEKNKFSDNTVVGSAMNRQDTYEFDFYIDSIKSKQGQESLKIGLCASVNWEVPLNIQQLIQTTFTIDCNGNLEYPDLYITKAQEMIYMGIIPQFKETFKYKIQEEQDQNDKYYVDLFQNQHSKQGNSFLHTHLYQFDKNRIQLPNFKFKNGQIIKCSMDANTHIFTMTVLKSEDKQNQVVKIPIPQYFKILSQIVTLKHDRDQVTIKNGVVVPQKLGYGEILGIGIQKSIGRVWLSVNGQFLNKPTLSDIQNMEAKKQIKGKGQKDKKSLKITMNPKKNNKNSEMEDMEQEIDDKTNKELERRKIKISPEAIKDLVPVVFANGPCKLNINIGGKSFRLHQDNINYGFL